MFDNNIIMQICAGLGILIMVLLIIGSFIPALGFEEDLDHPNLLRASFVVILHGLLRGAF
jgi:hypothetical protein